MAYRTNATEMRDEDAAAEAREIAAVDRDARGRRRRAAFFIGGAAAGLVVMTGLGTAVQQACRPRVLHCHSVTVVYENRPELPPETHPRCAWR